MLFHSGLSGSSCRGVYKVQCVCLLFFRALVVRLARISTEMLTLHFMEMQERVRVQGLGVKTLWSPGFRVWGSGVRAVKLLGFTSEQDLRAKRLVFLRALAYNYTLRKPQILI